MKSAYKNIIFYLMITSFLWVIIGDLVNMHVKLIYKKDLYANNIVFVKNVKKDKDYHFFKVKNNFQKLLFSINKVSLINTLNSSEYIFNETIISFSANRFYSLRKLRAPPYYL